MSLKLEKIAKLETLVSVAVLLQFLADLLIGREFTKIQFIAISCLFFFYIIMGLEAFFKNRFKKQSRKIGSVSNEIPLNQSRVNPITTS